MSICLQIRLTEAIGRRATADVSNWDGHSALCFCSKLSGGLGAMITQLDHVCSHGWVTSLAVEPVKPLSPHFFFWCEMEPIGRGAISAISCREKAQGRIKRCPSTVLTFTGHRILGFPRGEKRWLGCHLYISMKQKCNKHISEVNTTFQQKVNIFSEVQSMKLI